MSLRNLSAQSMVVVSGAWIDPERERPVLEGISLVAPLLPELKKAHGNLIRMQVTGSDAEKELGGIKKEEAALDKVHDRKVRGVFGVLTAMAELADTPDKAEGCIDLRDRLFPLGLRAVGRSYLDEAGDVEMVAGRLDDESRGLLKKFPLPGTDLCAEVEAWIEAGGKLGELETKRSRLEGSDKEDGVTRSEAAAARNRWIRTVNALLTNLDLVEDLDEETRRRILEPLRTAEAKADRRRQEADSPDEAVQDPS